MTIPDVLKPRRPRHTTVLMALGLLALFVVVGVAVLALRTASDSARQARRTQVADAAAITQLSSALRTTQAQLTQHGITPKAPPPTTIVKGIPGAAGASVVGPQGPAGQNGTSPDPAVIAQLVLSMIHPSPGPAGPAGPAGAVGPAGAAGADSTVPGPAGPAGAAGQDGKNGADGTPGATGPPPSGWTFTASDGTVYDCSPDAPGSTHYACTAQSGTGPQPSPSPSPSPSPAMSSSRNAAYRSTAVVSTGPRWP